MRICKKLQFYSKGLFCATAIAALSACAGNTLAPCTEPQKQPDTTANSNVEVKEKEQNTETLPVQKEITAVAAVKEPSNNTEPTKEVIPVKTSIDSSTSKSSSEQTNPVVENDSSGYSPSSTKLPIDPYTVFPAMADSVFAYAEALYKEGLVDSATSYLQRFRIIKPLWNNWENKTDSLLKEFGKSQAERAKQYEPLVLQIQNMNRVQSAYNIVAETADSLIALAPGDSLIRFANEQKQIAYANTLVKAKKDQDRIWKLAQEQARFDEAEKQAQTLLMRYRDFDDTLHIQAMIESIREQGQTINSSLAKYWESHDAEKAMAEVEDYIAKEQFSKAKDLLNKLKASKLRKEAIDKYTLLADTFCNAQRKLTSAAFGKAQSQKDDEKKKKLLQDAISYLDKCLSEYPETTQKKKVEENKSFLEKELNR